MFIYKINIQNINCVYLLTMEIKKAPFIIAQKRQKKGKPISPQSKDFTMNSPIVFILHPQSWCLLSLKSFLFPKIIWNTPTSGAFDKQSNFYRQKQLYICVCVCVCVCVCKRATCLRDRRMSLGEREKVMAPFWATQPGHLWRPE